jgi:uncharacterized protein YjiK
VVLLSLVTVTYATLVLMRHLNSNDAPALPSIRLGDYRLSLPPVRIPEIKDNLSGLTFNPDTETLFGILNGPSAIVELSREGRLLRYIKLQGFEDTEAITYLGNGLFAVAEERRRMISLLRINGSTDIVHYADGKRFLIEPEETGNKGLEGLTYDPLSQVLLVVKERSPHRTYLIPLASSASETPRVFRGWDPNAMGLRDMSGMQFQPDTGTVLVVSDESKEVVETTLAGEVLSSLRLRSGHGGLSDDIEQAEGVAVDDAGTLYIVSEPNMLYVYSKEG